MTTVASTPTSVKQVFSGSRELPKGWRWDVMPKLGFLGRGKSRHRPRYAEFLYGGPYPFVQTGEIREAGKTLRSYQQTYSERGLSQSKMWPAGTICITIAANIAETTILGLDACFPDSVVGFVADPVACNRDYIFYYLSYAKGDIQRFSLGTVQENINLDILARFPLALPPRPIQDSIAEILGALDDKIDCNRRMNEILEAIALALFKHWFVDGDGRDDTRPLTDFVGVDPTIRIPKGVEVPYVDMKALPTDSMSVSVVGRRPFTSGSKFQNGDTLFARITPCLENGKTAFVDFLEDVQAGFGSTEFIVLRGKVSVSPQFVYSCARDPALRSHAIKSMVGTSGRQRVRPECFEHFKIRRFSSERMREFDEQTLPWFQQIRANVKENQVLARTRDYLLPKLLSGEVEVNEAVA